MIRKIWISEIKTKNKQELRPPVHWEVRAQKAEGQQGRRPKISPQPSVLALL